MHSGVARDLWCGLVDPMNFGLAAHRLHRTGDDCALLQWAQLCSPNVRALGLKLHVTEGAYAALTSRGLLEGQIASVGEGRSGGLMRLVSRTAGGLSAGDALDGIFFFIDPTDPTSLYPEAQALKRQCVIHGKPFVATLAGAIEWLAVERICANPHVDLAKDIQRQLTLGSKTVALIAHDSRKSEMVTFASEHFDTLSKFQRRVATGTTGSLLNELAWSKQWPTDTPWVSCFQSGPLGGDAQIAELVLDGICHKVIFLRTLTLRANMKQTFNCWTVRYTAPVLAPHVSTLQRWLDGGLLL